MGPLEVRPPCGCEVSARQYSGPAFTIFLLRYVAGRSNLDEMNGFSWTVESGHYKVLADLNGWGFIRYLTDSYPGIVKLSGPLGVSARGSYVYTDRGADWS